MSIRKRLVIVCALLALILVSGTVFYASFEQWSIVDALYMTIITIATVGYSEIHPLGTVGRIYTMFLILAGMGTLLYSVSTVTAFIVEGELTDLLKKRKMEKQIDKLTDHYIVCGAGITGRHVVSEFMKTQNQFVVIDQCFDEIKKILTHETMNFIIGNAFEEAVLIQAGIYRAAGLVSALPTDKDNIFVTITARGLNPALRIVAKVNEGESTHKFIAAGANSVVSHKQIGGMRLASEMLRPAVVSFLDKMLKQRDTVHRVEQVKISPNSSLAGKTLRDSGIREKTGILVMGMIEEDGDKTIFNPPPDGLIKPDTTLIVVGEIQQIINLRRLAA
jgi:voltage-gated potassium channel